jgi:phosphoglycerate dehydrogenase-like enzyme
VLDDWPSAARESADWSRLAGRARVRFLGSHHSSEGEVARSVAGATVVVAMRERTPLPASLLSRLHDLRLIVTAGRRNAAIDVEAASGLGIAVCGTGSGPLDAAELTWGLILAALRHIPTEAARVRRGGWTGALGTSLEGRRLGVVGLGRLGSRVASVGRAFGMPVVAWSANLTEERCAELGVERAASLVELLTSSDIVTIHLVLSDRTRGLVGRAEFKAMRPHAWLVNTSRGPIVDEGALLLALDEGWIAGAALDVYDTEPLPLHHPFRRHPRVLATPHLGYVSDGSWRSWFPEIVEDIEAWLDGAPIRQLGS